MKIKTDIYFHVGGVKNTPACHGEVVIRSKKYKESLLQEEQVI